MLQNVGPEFIKRWETEEAGRHLYAIQGLVRVRQRQAKPDSTLGAAWIRICCCCCLPCKIVANGHRLLKKFWPVEHNKRNVQEFEVELYSNRFTL